MKLGLKLLSLILLAGTALAQTTYTTTADACGAKNLGYCQAPVVDDSGTAFSLILDTRVTGGGPIDTLSINYPYPGGTLFSVHGTFSGFVANPDGTHTAYYGTGGFASDSGTVNGTLPFYAYYVASCSGRGCYGLVVGWHYRVLAGATVTAE